MLFYSLSVDDSILNGEKRSNRNAIITSFEENLRHNETYKSGQIASLAKIVAW